MRIICNHFGDATFNRLANAFALSALQNGRVDEFDEIVTEAPAHRPGLIPHYTDNHAKLLVWRDAVHAGDEGEHLILMDADMLVLGDLREAFEEDYDIGWTWRPGRLPVNSGVVYVRVNDRSKRFMDAWVTRDNSLMQHRTLADHGRAKYGGANQASFMWLMLHGGGPEIARMKDLPCRKWNSVDQTWCDFDSDTRVLHIKGRLRDACVGEEMPAFFKALRAMSVNGVESQITIDRLADIWRQYDQAEVAA